MANKKYDKEFKDSIAKLQLEEGSLDNEKISPSVYEENRILKKLAAELEKATAFFAKEIDN